MSTICNTRPISTSNNTAYWLVTDSTIVEKSQKQKISSRSTLAAASQKAAYAKASSMGPEVRA